MEKTMERLTMRDVGGRAFWVSPQSPGGGYRLSEDMEDQRRLDRLAAYEDTGLEPEEVKEHETACIEIMTRTYGPLHQKISQWLQAEKDGRLVVLPCKVGDEVYSPATGRWDAATICNIELTSIGVRFGWVQCDVGPEVNELWDDGCFLAEDIGKTVFLTREEAETALKKGEET